MLAKAILRNCPHLSFSFAFNFWGNQKSWMFPFFFGSIQSYSAKKNINIIIRKNYFIRVFFFFFLRNRFKLNTIEKVKRSGEKKCNWPSSIDNDHRITSNLIKIRLRMIKLQITSSNFELISTQFFKGSFISFF